MGDSIASYVEGCLDLFHLVTDQVGNASDTTGNLKFWRDIRDERTRFKVWAGNIGAHSTGMSSLDYRLRDSSHIRVQVVRLLQDLDELLEDALAIVGGYEFPWDQTSDAKGTKEGHEVTIETPTQDTAENDDVLEESDLDQISVDVVDVVNCLLRLSAAIRNPAPHDRFAASVFTDTSHYELFDIRHVQSKFNRIDMTLAERLGKAISRRRQYFKYREAHHMKLAHGLDLHRAADAATTTDSADPQTVASSIPQHLKGGSHPTEGPLIFSEDRSESGQSQTSYASSAAGKNEYRIPPLPKEALAGPFECPFCYRIITATSTISWKRHVHEDLRPYICLEKDCIAPEKEFARRHHWMNHMRQSHWSTYTCPASCGAMFLSVSECQEHLTQSHPGPVQADKMIALIELGAQPLDLSEGIACPLCGDSLKSAQQYRHHVGRHQEQLALFALPIVGSNDDAVVDEGDADGQAQSRGTSEPDSSSGDRDSAVVGNLDKAEDTKLQDYLEGVDLSSRPSSPKPGSGSLTLDGRPEKFLASLNREHTRKANQSKDGLGSQSRDSGVEGDTVGSLKVEDIVSLLNKIRVSKEKQHGDQTHEDLLNSDGKMQGSDDESPKARPPLTKRAKPEIPPRPTASSSGNAKDDHLSKPKPPAPTPSLLPPDKLAVLQAEILMERNKRPGLGPKTSKKGDAPKEQNPVGEKKQFPSTDARAEEKAKATMDSAKMKKSTKKPMPAVASRATIEQNVQWHQPVVGGSYYPMQVPQPLAAWSQPWLPSQAHPVVHPRSQPGGSRYIDSPHGISARHPARLPPLSAQTGPSNPPASFYGGIAPESQRALAVDESGRLTANFPPRPPIRDPDLVVERQLRLQQQAPVSYFNSEGPGIQDPRHYSAIPLPPPSSPYYPPGAAVPSGTRPLARAASSGGIPADYGYGNYGSAVYNGDEDRGRRLSRRRSGEWQYEQRQYDQGPRLPTGTTRPPPPLHPPPMYGNVEYDVAPASRNRRRGSMYGANDSEARERQMVAGMAVIERAMAPTGVPLTADMLRRIGGRPPHTSSAQATDGSNSGDEQRRRSPHTMSRTIQSPTAHGDDITIKVEGGATINVGGIEMRTGTAGGEIVLTSHGTTLSGFRRDDEDRKGSRRQSKQAEPSVRRSTTVKDTNQ
ncbi:hypothetical protein JDV02_003285 [Purpureocillium takamizusanense]|uniref:C2H2-type domain-containing protein n=1 Tax=Purpureocillium takamizusanense TaxID=2060973 RepID=A0A9Q8V8A8_9HYPO|nr:uncharacterized protein JDV02_003285 [Purpureocillium takamizusanense]UNI16895.1 hypothetical protein JDV02_003285 [Purpureocillium takamizusanense]